MVNFSSNTFPKLTKFTIEGPAPTFGVFSGNDLFLISDFTLPAGTTIKEFNNNNLWSIKDLNMFNRSLSYFKYNRFDELLTANLSYNKLESVEMSFNDKLKILDLSHSSELGSLRYLKLPSVETLILESSPMLYEVSGIVAPNAT